MDLVMSYGLNHNHSHVVQRLFCVRRVSRFWHRCVGSFCSGAWMLASNLLAAASTSSDSDSLLCVRKGTLDSSWTCVYTSRTNQPCKATSMAAACAHGIPVGYVRYIAYWRLDDSSSSRTNRPEDIPRNVLIEGSELKDVRSLEAFASAPIELRVTSAPARAAGTDAHQSCWVRADHGRGTSAPARAAGTDEHQS